MNDDWAWLRRARLGLRDHGLACFPPGTTVGPRLVGSWQFVWLARGEGEWELAGRSHRLVEGSVLLARPGMRDLLRWSPTRRILHGWVAFDLQPAGGGPPASLPLLRQPAADDILLPLLRHLRRLLADRPSGWEALADGALRQALLVFASGAGGIDREDADDTPALVDHALAWLAQRWEGGVLRAPALAAWAHALGVSREHLIRAFRRSYGVTPMEAVRLLRLDRAAQRLAAGGETVQAVASATGFASPFHFARRFAAVYGCPPTAFRRRVAAGGGHGHVALVKVRTMASRVWRTR